MINEKCAVRRRISELTFAVIELTLYLDTHPDDCEMLAELCAKQKELAKCKEQYRCMGGELTPDGCRNAWTWTSDPWPWEYAAN